MEETHTHHEGIGAPIEYLKFWAILLGIFFLAWAFAAYQGMSADSFMRGFMGVFFIVFGLFKLLDLPGFVMSYIGYDLIASRWRNWTYLYPFIEIGLGVGYLFGSMYLDYITFPLMIIGAIGVQRQLFRGSKIQCACLGTYVKLPLTTVSLVEDLLMGAMALYFIIR